MKLLLAEDDLLQRKVLERLLSRAGHEVETVSGGADALQKLIEHEFHFLITDWDMPGMDGATLCRHVRAAQLPDYVYILMLTGHTAEADLLAAFEAGADDYVRKPASEAELLARVKAGCRLLEAEHSLRIALAHVRELSITDPLTALYNRRYLNEQLPRELERSRRYQRPLSLVMADLDHFKRLNDDHGHLAGDEILKCFADRLRASTRASSDWIVRYGGEEFVVVLPETQLPEAATVAEKIRTACALPMQISACPEYVTASFGVACVPSPSGSAFTAENLLHAADGALYRSKRCGRNCVTVHDP